MATTTITAERQAAALPCARDDYFDEVWDGVLKMSPAPNWEHQDLSAGLTAAFRIVVWEPGLGRVLPAVNVSPLADDWPTNYRIPDLSVYLAGNPAVFHEAHIQGGPDLIIEIVSAGEDAHAKLAFYASIGTGELLIVRRGDDWSLELFRLENRVLTLAETATPGAGAAASRSAGVTFALEPGTPRPAVVVAHPASGRAWRA